jgi:valyl-tRNA synthetase
VEFGVLTSFAYPLDGDLGEIVVATTRVETMLADTVVSIFPDESRHNHLHGKFAAIHPFNERTLPIICDAILVDPIKVRPRRELCMSNLIFFFFF